MQRGDWLKIWECIFLLLAVSCVGTTGLRAQGQAYMTGYIQDPAGAAIPHAIVDIRDEVTGAMTILRSDNAGLYRSPTLRPASYAITVKAKGFRTLVRRGVAVVAGQPLGLNLRLELGATTQQVVVTGGAPLMRTEDAGLGQNVEQADVTRLPLFTRSAGSLQQFTPGVVYQGDGPFMDGPHSNLGAMNNLNTPVLNGFNLSSNRTDVCGACAGFNPPADALREFRVVEGQYSARYGSAMGPLLVYETKSGTNAFHGSLYEYFRNEAMDTYNGFTDTKPLDRYNVFGGDVGGPIKKNKLFFFTLWQGDVWRQPNSATLTVPTAAMKNGDFSGLKAPNGSPAAIYDPATTRIDPVTGRVIRDPFPANIIPTTRFDPVALNVMKFFPNPNQPGSITGGGNLATTGGYNFTKRRGVTRIDWNISNKDSLTGDWLFDDTTSLDRGFAAIDAISPAASPLPQLSFLYHSQLFGVRETHIISPQLFVSNSFSWMPELVTRTNIPALCPSCKYAEKLGITNYAGARLPQSFGGDLGFPSFGFSGYTSLGPGALQFKEEPENTFKYDTDLTFVRGTHTIQMGLHVERGDEGAPDQILPTGSFSFGPNETALPGVANTGNTVASTLLGLVDSASTSLGPFQQWWNWYYAPFVQDDWKVTRKLTLNLGLRWDIDGPVYELHNEGNSFDPYEINPISGTPGVIKFFGRNGWPNNFYNTDPDRFAPRFGFA
jgi:hypothetical protein